MRLAGLLLELGAPPADCVGSLAVTLVGRDELDAAVAVPVVVLVHKSRHPLARLHIAGERPGRVIGPELGFAEQSFE